MTDLKTVVILVGVVLVCVSVLTLVSAQPQQATPSPGIYVEVPDLGTDAPVNGSVVYVGTDEQRRQQAIKNILAESEV